MLTGAAWTVMTKVASTMAKEPNLRAIGALDQNEGSLKGRCLGGGGVREIVVGTSILSFLWKRRERATRECRA